MVIHMYTQHKHYIASNVRRRRKNEEEEAKREFRQHKKVYFAVRSVLRDENET